MSNVTVIADDKAVSLDSLKYEDIDYDWPDNLWAIQWDGTTGQIEYRDGAFATASLSDVQPYIDLWNTTDNSRYEARKAEGLAQDALALARHERAVRLAQSDYWALSDRTMTQAQIDFRKALRDLPTHATDWNPSMGWYDELEDRDLHQAHLVGVIWPDDSVAP